MVKFTYQTKDNKTNLGLGITRENMNRLLEDKPIKVALDNVGKVDGEVLIFFGETEESITQELKEFISPETKLEVDPRLKLNQKDLRRD